MEEKIIFKTNRSNWEQNERFHLTMASFLINIHNQFKHQIKKIRKLCENYQLKEAKYNFISLKSSLDMHHHIEEVKLFPPLEERLKFKIETKKLLEDHHKMNEMLKELKNLFSNLEAENLQQQLSQKMKDFEEHMLQHLNDEEDIAIPAMLETPYLDI